MTRRRRQEKELRCFCARAPLLATYGHENGELFVHVKSWKQKRIFCELYIKGGEVKLRCRDCFRWHKVRIRGNQASLSESKPLQPEQIAG